MSKHKKRPHRKDNHGQNRHKQKRHGTEHAPPKKTKMIHHDWKFWVAIVLMLLGFSAYVLTMDESIRPGGVDEHEVPAAVE